jgi:hypothetical protein
MTVSVAFAGFDSHGKGIVGIFADSRVTRVDDTYSDDARKVLLLSDFACATGAGDARAIVAIHEKVRGLIAEENTERIGKGLSALSLWHQASFFFHEIDLYRMGNNLTRPTHVVVAGFASNGTPVLAQAVFSQGRHERHLFKPLPGQIVSRSIGLPSAVQLVTEAIRYSVASRDEFAAVLAVAHGIAADKSTEFRGIGGPISVAYCESGSSFTCPIYLIDGQYLQAGEMLDSVPPDQRVIAVPADAHNLFSRFDAENQIAPKFTGGVTRASSIYAPPMCLGFEKLFWGEEPAWLCDDAMPVPYVFGVEGGPAVTFDYCAAGTLHSRDADGVKFHAGGAPPQPPPPGSIVNAPSAPDELLVCSGPFTIKLSNGAGGGFR